MLLLICIFCIINVEIVKVYYKLLNEFQNIPFSLVDA